MDRTHDQEKTQEDNKQAWEEPRLEFVEPKLTKHGDLKTNTGFFGAFSP